MRRLMVWSGAASTCQPQRRPGSLFAQPSHGMRSLLCSYVRTRSTMSSQVVLSAAFGARSGIQRRVVLPALVSVNVEECKESSLVGQLICKEADSCNLLSTARNEQRHTRSTMADPGFQPVDEGAVFTPPAPIDVPSRALQHQPIDPLRLFNATLLLGSWQKKLDSGATRKKDSELPGQTNSE
jgi:hypothetical protein